MTLDLVSTPSPTTPHPATITGLATLANMAFAGANLGPLWRELTGRLSADARDAAALMDLSIIKQLTGDRANGLAFQAEALRLTRIYHQPASRPAQPALKLLAFVVAGDFMANTPLDFLLQGSGVTLDLLYVSPGQPVPGPVPEHDVAIVAIGQSDENQAALDQVAALLENWPRPVLNAPAPIARLAREQAWRQFGGLEGVVMGATVRLPRGSLEEIAMGRLAVGAALAGGEFPLIVRPAGSHAGQGLERLAGPAELRDYLLARSEEEFYLSRFVDYRSADGLYRKYRIALIDGRPYACHMAISDHWMIHYLNAGMHESEAKRAEEARFMVRFDEDFARRHRVAFAGLAARAGLEYFAIDCAETPEGKLLVFEADVAMIVHAMDPADLFPYKPVQMRKVFAAFTAMLDRFAAPEPEKRRIGALG